MAKRVAKSKKSKVRVARAKRPSFWNKYIRVGSVRWWLGLSVVLAMFAYSMTLFASQKQGEVAGATYPEGSPSANRGSRPSNRLQNGFAGFMGLFGKPQKTAETINVPESALKKQNQPAVQPDPAVTVNSSIDELFRALEDRPEENIDQMLSELDTF